MALKKGTTSKKVATDASKEMKNPKKTIRSIAASDLVQVDKRKQTSKEVATKASKTLSSKITTKKEKELAGSALSQASRKTKPKGKIILSYLYSLCNIRPETFQGDDFPLVPEASLFHNHRAIEEHPK